MITLSIILCNAIGMCSEVNTPVEQREGENPGFACMMYGQLEALKAAEAKSALHGQSWYVRRWTCGAKRHSI